MLPDYPFNSILKLFFISLPVLITVSYMLYRNRKIRLRCTRETERVWAELENAKRKEKELRESLDLKSQELSTYTIHLIQKNEVIDRLKTALKELKNGTSDRQIAGRVNELQRVIDASMLVDRDWNDFLTNFSQIHPLFFQTLTDRYPALTTNDLRLCGLIRMNLSLKESSAALGVSNDSMKIARYRLRKKLNLAKEENLNQFIWSLGSEKTARKFRSELILEEC